MQTLRNVSLMVCIAALTAAAALMAVLSIIQFINPPSMAGVGAVSAGTFEALLELPLAMLPAVLLNFALAGRSRWDSRAMFWRRTHLWMTAVICAGVVAGRAMPIDFETAVAISAAAFALLMATQVAFGIVAFVVVLRSTHARR